MNEYSPPEIITLIILYLKEEFFFKNSPANFSVFCMTIPMIRKVLLFGKEI